MPRDSFDAYREKREQQDSDAEIWAKIDAAIARGRVLKGDLADQAASHIRALAMNLYCPWKRAMARESADKLESRELVA